MNLIIDIGNTTAKIVAFRNGTPVDCCVTSNKTLKELPDFIRRCPCSRGIVSSVIELTPEVKQMLQSIAIPLIMLNEKTPVPIRNSYRTPETLGYDRLAAAIGAVAQYPGHHLLIIDSGTCITYEFVDATGCYLGGNISPGIQMRLQAMHTGTNRLPLIATEGPCPAVGYDTETAMRSGTLSGIKHEMEGYIRTYKRKHPDLFVFLTGGNSFNFDNSIKNIIFADKFLVPRGLNCILEYNNDKQE